MNLSNPKQVIDFDDFLPADGESRCDLHYVDGTLSLDIFYEKDDFHGEIRRTLSFFGAMYFLKTPFPGYSFFGCIGDRDISLLNSLVEYEYSDLLEIDADANRKFECKHYRLFLHSSGMAIHVIAQSCDVSAEFLSCES